MSATVIQFPNLKENLESLTYEQILEVRFADLRHSFQRAGYGDERDLVCTFSMDMKVWKAIKKAGQLGQVYNCDLSNFLYRKGIMKHYAVPSVNDSARASKGRKTITVRFGGF